jgi:methylenetetrahydrofolate--tRNA-(uracil-5-)-methyltransferase
MPRHHLGTDDKGNLALTGLFAYRCAMARTIHIIGGGLAGSEAAWQAAQLGAQVILHEMRPIRSTDAHQTSQLAELVCSNSFRSDDHERNAVGLLHEEMRRCNSVIMQAADRHKVPAGGALAVDRIAFSQAVQDALDTMPNIEIRREEVTEIPTDDTVIIATGPLTSSALTEQIIALTGEEQLAFFDAIAPIVHKESIDFSKAWFQSRYDKGEGKDYINCPMDQDEYETFVQALIDAEKVDFHEWEKSTPYFDACLPIEVMAERGPKTLSFGPMKPVGLTNPHKQEAPYAVVQLRQDNKMGTLFNIVGFQTKMRYGEQQRLFRTIPGLENAEFARLGGLHRNTFIKSPILLDEELRLKSSPNVRFAGQITGVEGYVESAAVGLMAGRFAGGNHAYPPRDTALGSLLAHITGEAEAKSFQPMNINFGLFPPLAQRTHKKERAGKMSERALASLDAWHAEQEAEAA